MRRYRKQILIFVIFLLLVALIVSGVKWLTRPRPSCFDGIQNQGEEDIDCGGPCQPCEKLYLKEIKILETKAVHLYDNVYGLAAKIKNVNVNYGTGNLKYIFKYFDKKGNLLGQKEGLTYILPNQIKYLVESKVISVQPIAKVVLDLEIKDWQKPKIYQYPHLVIYRQEFRNLETGNSQASGVVVNKTDFNFDKVEIKVLLFDYQNNLIALGTTEVRTLLSRQEREFLVKWPYLIKSPVGSMVMEAETNFFDFHNFITPSGEVMPFME